MLVHNFETGDFHRIEIFIGKNSRRVTTAMLMVYIQGKWVRFMDSNPK